MDKAQTGRLGEDFAALFLEQNGYKITSRNFRTRLGEIDIIAEKDGIISFVEVKTRSQNSLYSPREAVTISKQKKIIKAASEYILLTKCEKQPRFDVFEIVCKIEKDDFKVISHCFLENAF